MLNNVFGFVLALSRVMQVCLAGGTLQCMYALEMKETFGVKNSGFDVFGLCPDLSYCVQVWWNPSMWTFEIKA